MTLLPALPQQSVTPARVTANTDAELHIDRVPVPKGTQDVFGRSLAGIAGAAVVGPLGALATLAAAGGSSPLTLPLALVAGGAAAVVGYRHPRFGLTVGIGALSSLVGVGLVATLLAPPLKFVGASIAFGVALGFSEQQGKQLAAETARGERQVPGFVSTWSGGEVGRIGRGENGIYVWVDHKKIDGLKNLTEAIVVGARLEPGTPLGEPLKP